MTTVGNGIWRMAFLLSDVTEGIFVCLAQRPVTVTIFRLE